MSVRGHDVATMNNEYVDVDGSVQSEADLLQMFRDTNIDKLGNVFSKNDLTVSLRVSQNTVLTVHEMVAADIFIGSRSGLSMQVVGSISRASFILLPCCDRISAIGYTPFSYHSNDNDGSRLVTDESLTTMQLLWHEFSQANSVSAEHAFSS